MTRTPYRHAWRVRYPLGMVDAYRAMGTVAAPLLAGFTLSSTVVLLTLSSGNRIPFSGWATAAFGIAVVLFVFSVQFTFLGLLYAASPSERLAWLPHFVGQDPDESAHAAAERVQAKDQVLQYRYFRQAGLLYDLGVLGYTAGLGLILVPRVWTVARGITLAVVTTAFVVEIIWTISSLTRSRPSWLLPSYDWATGHVSSQAKSAASAESPGTVSRDASKKRTEPPTP
jgi:hypothetical protein